MKTTKQKVDAFKKSLEAPKKPVHDKQNDICKLKQTQEEWLELENLQQQQQLLLQQLPQLQELLQQLQQQLLHYYSRRKKIKSLDGKCLECKILFRDSRASHVFCSRKCSNDFRKFERHHCGEPIKKRTSPSWKWLFQ